MTYEYEIPVYHFSISLLKWYIQNESLSVKIVSWSFTADSEPKECLLRCESKIYQDMKQVEAFAKGMKAAFDEIKASVKKE